MVWEMKIASLKLINSNQKEPETKSFFYVPAVSCAIGVSFPGMETRLLKPPSLNEKPPS